MPKNSEMTICQVHEIGELNKASTSTKNVTLHGSCVQLTTKKKQKRFSQIFRIPRAKPE